MLRVARFDVKPERMHAMHTERRRPGTPDEAMCLRLWTGHSAERLQDSPSAQVPRRDKDATPRALRTAARLPHGEDGGRDALTDIPGARWVSCGSRRFGVVRVGRGWKR